MGIEKLLEKTAGYLTDEDVESILRAYVFAEKSHDGQLRKSGEPFIHHPVAVADILVDLQLDVATVIAALLHDVVEDTGVTLDQVKAEFGHTVSILVDGVTKLNKRMKFKSDEEHIAENHRKMFVAMAEDIRVILIKLADRLHNMRTLKYVSEQKQRHKSEETLEIFAPLAHRLGIMKIKWELEDISLRYLNPQQYYRIVHLMKKKRIEREVYLDELVETFKLRLTEMDINFFDVSGRPKHIYSIFKKMATQGKEFNEIYDLTAIRIIVETVRDCYAVLGITHTIWKPMPGRFKDYIAMPKSNMYQSLHTTVFGPKGEPIEVQIRTKEMHRTSEYGIAAHWLYKEGTQVEKSDLEKRLAWFREMMELQKDAQNAEEFVEGLKVDWFSAAVFVFTPKGNVIELPSGSVPLDFAYRIHTEIGNRCIGSKVNGKIVPLEYKLKTGDIVEILTSKHSYGPSRDWLKLVKSTHARSKIRSWFKKQQRDESVVKGKEMVEALLKKHDYNINEIMTSERLGMVTKEFNFHDVDDLYAAVGYNGISVSQVVSKLTQHIKNEGPIVLPEVKSLPQKSGKQDQGVIVKGVDNLLVRLSGCCTPVPGDEISGYVTQGRGVTVHRSSCPNLKNVSEERRICVEWIGEAARFYQVDIEVFGLNRKGLLNEVLQAVNDAKTDLSQVSAKGDKKRGLASMVIRIFIQNVNHLQAVVDRVKGVPDVYSVRRIMQ